jgi:signal transduction histidine kinase
LACSGQIRQLAGNATILSDIRSHLADVQHHVVAVIVVVIFVVVVVVVVAIIVVHCDNKYDVYLR